MTDMKDAIANGCSLKATGRALARAWFRNYGSAATREILDEMLREVADAEAGR